MVTPLRGTDPGSVSQLGGILRTTAAGLELREWSVIEPFGVVSAEVAARRSLDQAQLQAQADRLAAQVARTRSRLVRELAQARAHLAQAAEVARART